MTASKQRNHPLLALLTKSKTCSSTGKRIISRDPLQEAHFSFEPIPKSICVQLGCSQLTQAGVLVRF